MLLLCYHREGRSSISGRPRRYYAIYKHENTNPYTQILCDLLGKYYSGSLWMPKVVF